MTLAEIVDAVFPLDQCDEALGLQYFKTGSYMRGHVYNTYDEGPDVTTGPNPYGYGWVVG